MDFDIIIGNGRVIDGTGNPWFRADVGIRDGRIVKLSRTPLNDACRVIDAKGSLVCSGFINLHSHSDSTILSHNNAENCLAMGLVTELVGSCGTSVAPITEKFRDLMNERLKEVSWSPMEKVDWLTMGDWVGRLEKKGIGVNIAPLVGHGTVRSCVMGEEGEGGERVVPTEEEMTGMKTMVDSAMREGAFGLSTGLTYAPGRNALTGEVVELARVVASYGGLYSSHMRCEGDNLLEATEEFIEICDRAGVRGTISHHKAMGRKNYGKVCETLRMVDRARVRGVDIIIDQYPWRHGGITKSLGERFKVGEPDGPPIRTRSELVEKLKDEEEWEKIRAAIRASREKEVGMYEERRRKLEEGGGWTSEPFSIATGGTILHSRKHPELEGKSFQEVVKAFEVDGVMEGIRALLIADDGYTVAGGEPYSEDDIINIMRYPWTAISTDQYAMDNSKITLQAMADNIAMQHPRGWGTYPKILGRYVRDEGVLTIEEAIRKMTSLPAMFLGLQDRGIVRENMWADLVVFNPDTVKCRATYGNPRLYPEGISYVLVNGQLAVDNGEPTGALAGKVLRHKN